MIGSAFGVLFDGFAYGMLLFLLSVGLSVTLGMMNFVNLAHCSFAMLGGYVTVTLTMGLDCNIPSLQILGWTFPGLHLFTIPPLPFLVTLPFAFLSAALASVVFERRALPAPLPSHRSRPVPAHDRDRVHVGCRRGLYLRDHSAAGEPARLSARHGLRSWDRISASTGCS